MTEARPPSSFFNNIFSAFRKQRPILAAPKIEMPQEKLINAESLLQPQNELKEAREIGQNVLETIGGGGENAVALANLLSATQIGEQSVSKDLITRIQVASWRNIRDKVRELTDPNKRSEFCNSQPIEPVLTTLQKGFDYFPKYKDALAAALEIPLIKGKPRKMDEKSEDALVTWELSSLKWVIDKLEEDLLKKQKKQEEVGASKIVSLKDHLKKEGQAPPEGIEPSTSRSGT